MAYYDTINLVAGDDKPEINFTLRDSNTAAGGFVLDPDDSSTWAPLNLTGATVRVKFRKLGSTTTLDTMTCVGVVPLTNGVCYMPWNLTTLDVTAGTYEGEIELEYSDGRILTVYDKLKFKVRSEFS
jgi:hypothetical protein